MKRFKWIFGLVVVAVGAATALVYIRACPEYGYSGNPYYATEKADWDAYVSEYSERYSAPLASNDLTQLPDSSSLANADQKDTCWLLYFDSHFETCRITIDFRT